MQAIKQVHYKAGSAIMEVEKNMAIQECTRTKQELFNIQVREPVYINTKYMKNNNLKNEIHVL